MASNPTADRWSFYFRHSINDLRVNGKRTIFALLCIAAGVAAIVSLQTLAVMIGDTLTGSLQESNRGDIQLRTGNEFEFDETHMQAGVDSGVLQKKSVSFFGSRQADYQIRGEGIQTLRTWLQDNYPGQAELTYRQPLSHILNVLFGNGNGASMTVLETGTTAPSVNPIVVEGAVYPFYSTIEARGGKPLGELLQKPTDLVISERIAGQLQVKVGAVVRISGSKADFVVRGVVADAQEVKHPGKDFINALYGFYYLDVSAVALFDDVDVYANVAYIKLTDGSPQNVNEVNRRFTDAFSFFETSTTEDLRADYSDFAGGITRMVSLMGLISLLIGCIGIINTMQVIVRRRTLEVAVLKSLGLQASQITILFLVEAFMMGILGSLLGIVLGWGAIFAIKGGAETLLATGLTVRIVPSAAFNGFVVGVLVTTVFGILPTLAAARVRPGMVLRPTQDIVPTAGFLRRALSLLVLILVLAAIAQSILGSFMTALWVILGAFLAAGFLYLILYLMVWAVGSLMPSFGIAELKVSLRQLVAARARSAVTMLALVIGVFSLSLITLFSETIHNILETSMGTESGGNIAITVPGPDQLQKVQSMVDGRPGVNSYQVLQSYGVELVAMEEPGPDGVLVRVEMDQISERMKVKGPTRSMEAHGKNFQPGTLLRNVLGRIDAREVAQLADKSLTSGRHLDASDEGKPVMVLVDNDIFQSAELDVGDRLLFRHVDRDGNGIGEEFARELVGIERQSFFSSDFAGPAYSLRSAFPEDRHPDNISIMVSIDKEEVAKLRRELLTIPGAFVLDTAAITRLVTSLLDTFTAFPLIVAALGLVVGGIVIANSVVLSTMERRREIAVMKAIGLQRERVLAMLLTENVIMGLLAGLLGVGIGLFALVTLSATGGLPLDVIPFGTAFLLMGLCVLVALIAAVATAWSASGEKPLNVLRYE